ncbi:MAG TPA: hypothetical protein ENJ13_03315 [Chromatiales bacterium]|nr:hypothetical protein [Chromatiales bacterium]
MANTSNLQIAEPFELAPITGKVHVSCAKEELPQTSMDWRKITLPALVGVSFFAGTAGTSLVAHSYNRSYGLNDKMDLSRSRFISSYTVVLAGSVDDMPSPAFSCAGNIKGHFTKAKKLQFSSELFD